MGLSLCDTLCMGRYLFERVCACVFIFGCGVCVCMKVCVGFVPERER